MSEPTPDPAAGRRPRLEWLADLVHGQPDDSGRRPGFRSRIPAAPRRRRGGGIGVRLAEQRSAWIQRQQGARGGFGPTGRPAGRVLLSVNRWGPAVLTWPILVGVGMMAAAVFAENATGFATLLALLTVGIKVGFPLARKFIPVIGRLFGRTYFTTNVGTFVLCVLTFAAAATGPTVGRFLLPLVGLFYVWWEVTEWNRDLLVYTSDNRYYHVYGIIRPSNPHIKFADVKKRQVKQTIVDFIIRKGSLEFDSIIDDRGIALFGPVARPQILLARVEDVLDGIDPLSDEPLWGGRYEGSSDESDSDGS